MPALPLHHDDPRGVGGYRLTARLGEGGQGVVYLGEGPSGERVAVKMLKTTDAAARARFAREMRAARQVAAFCTAAVLDSSAEGELPYVVSEYVDGPSLQQRVQERGPLRGGDLERLAVNTASALAAIHGAGIVHRDLKPANVLLGPDGPRVVDFGIARAIDAETHTQLVGTPAYFAPEWLEGHPPTDRSDVFAWAGTIVYAATGRPPFGRATSLPATLHRIAHGEPDLDGVPPSLLPLLLECLAKDPARRPAARDLMVRLVDPSATGPAGVLSAPPAPATTGPAPAFAPVPPPGQPMTGAPAETTRPGGRRRSRGGLVAGGAAVLVLLACAGGAVLLLGRGEGKAERNTGTRGTPASSTPPAASSTPATGGATETGAGTGGTVPAAFAGTWKGTLTQTGGITTGDATTTVTIRLTAGRADGTSDYESWDCHDTLKVTSASATTVTFQETAKSSNGSAGFCIGGTMTLKRVANGLAYESPGVGTTTGTLRRAG
ncbi:serine/threonine-protein kinase [Actinomadura roseirufa]|uniref:serine/threonine-protein kinase n=1 Tax=Actinomadura roseirufa TaxID=2094049 RepID=UPI0013F16739|nr:serine/threonine-protein kinase [Actinomadura roseirufa]